MEMTRSSRLLGSLVVIATIVLPSTLAGQDPDGVVLVPTEPHPAADEAISRLKSPYCPGLMLEVCTSYTGASLRDSIQEMAREGWTTNELVDWVLANHGDEYLAYPRMSGRGLLAWLVPPLALLLGVGVVVTALRHMRASSPEVETVEGGLTEEDEALLRQALREMDASEEPIF
jgi:cytochrome c-type biogenesis protein CcmH/NrfF